MSSTYLINFLEQGCPDLGNRLTCYLLTLYVQKVKLPLSTQRRRSGREEVQLLSFLTSASDDCERSISGSGQFTIGKKAGIHWTEVWVGLSASLCVLEEIKIVFWARGSAVGSGTALQVDSRLCHWNFSLT